VVNKGFFHKRGKVIHREKEVFYRLNLLEWSLSTDNRQTMTTTTFNSLINKYPARVNNVQASKILGFNPDEIRILITYGHLKPCAKPKQNSDEFIDPSNYLSHFEPLSNSSRTLSQSQVQSEDNNAEKDKSIDNRSIDNFNEEPSDSLDQAGQQSSNASVRGDAKASASSAGSGQSTEFIAVQIFTQFREKYI
jgi:hypothetical protein